MDQVFVIYTTRHRRRCW